MVNVIFQCPLIQKVVQYFFLLSVYISIESPQFDLAKKECNNNSKVFYLCSKYCHFHSNYLVGVYKEMSMTVNTTYSL